MILQIDDIKRVLAKDPYEGYFLEAREQYERLRMHCTGENVEEYVEDLPEFMREGQRDTLVNLMKGNRDLIYRVMQPRDKIYYAKGGIEQYNLPEGKEPAFREFLSNVADGLTMIDFIRQKVQPHYDYDPNGIILIEIDANGKPTPVIKCINDIYTYVPNGRALEYLILKVTDDERQTYIDNGVLPKNIARNERVFRIIDDASDMIVIEEAKGSKINIVSEVPNEFGYVPAIIISDICGYATPIFESPLSPAVALLDTIQYDKGLFSWAYNRQAFPKEWMQLFKCQTCEGHKDIDGQPCPECGGTGITPHLRNSDVAIVDYRGEGGQNIPNPPIGVVAPVVEALQYMEAHNGSLEDTFEYTIFGVQKTVSGNLNRTPSGKGGNQSNTAYEAQQNEQPKHDRLKLFGSWRDSIMKFIADTCGWFIYRNEYEGSAILCGDRFMIESPDATWDRYNKAVAANAPMAILDSLLIEYIENKYNNNPLLYRKFLLLMQVEPFVHEPVETIWLDPQLPIINKLEKKYFDEWTSTITDYDIASVPDEGGAEILRQLLRKYVTGKYIFDKKQDSLLITASGEILNIGDTVKIIPGREQKPDHVNREYKVDAVHGVEVTMSGDGVDGLFGYKIADVYRPSPTTGLPAEPIEKLYS